jgi:hypothetical protein
MALYSNPAHLGVGPRGTTEIRVLDTRLYAGGRLFQFEHYNNAFVRSDPLSAEQAQATLNDWFGQGRRSGAMYMEVVPFAISFQPEDRPWSMGVGLRVRTVLKSGANKGLFDLLLRGTGTNRTVPVNGRYRAYNTIDLTGAFSYDVEGLPLIVGAAPRFIVGMGFADGTLNSEVEVTEDALVHRFDYTARAAGTASSGLYDVFNVFEANPLSGVGGVQVSGGAGLGGGLDLGATYQVRPDLHVSTALTDLGLIRWSRDAQTVTPENNTFRFDGVELDVRQLNNEFDGDVGAYVEHYLDSLAREAYEDVERTRTSFTTGLPTTLHVSSTWDRDRVTLNGGVSVGLNRRAGAVPRPPAVHAGAETMLGVVPVRAGVRFWGTQAVTLSGGFGLHVGGYKFDLGASVTPNTTFVGGGARYAVGLSIATVQF